MYAVRNKVPDPAVSFTESELPRDICFLLVMGTTALNVFDAAAGKCLEYTTIIPEEDLINADGFIVYYPVTGRGPGMTCVNMHNDGNASNQCFSISFCCLNI